MSGGSLVKPAAVKIARIICSDAVANKLAMFFLQTTPSSGTSKNSQLIIWNKLLLLPSEVEILIQSWVRLQILETMHSLCCSC